MLESLSPIDVALIKKIGGNGSSYTLPIASPTQLGGVKPVAKTDAMTQSVGVDESGALWAPKASSGGSYYEEQTTSEDTEVYTFLIDTERYNRYTITVYQPGTPVSPSVAFVRGGLRCNYLTNSGTAPETYFFLELVESDAQSNGGTKRVVGNSRRSNNPDANTFLSVGIGYLTTEANCIQVKGTTLPAGTIISVRCWE